MRASYAGNSDLYDMRVRAGADENIKDNKGQTAADYRKQLNSKDHFDGLFIYLKHTI